MKVLITGSHSLLGKSLWESVPESAHLLLTDLPNKIITSSGFEFKPLDITDKNNTKKLIKNYKPHFIIHLASMSNVDSCQKHPKLSHDVNVKGTHNILKAAEIARSKIIFTSSNGIFDSENPPYSESARPRPTHNYGKDKLQAEKLIQSYSKSFLITRPTTMYGWQPKKARLNPVTWVLSKLKAGEELNMVNDNWIPSATLEKILTP
jgi:dTDP-4-dehydrorhamnose reductase